MKSKDLLKGRPGFEKRMTKEEINTFPLKKWEGAVHVVEDQAGLDSAIKRLSQELCLGFDTETRPAFKKGQHFLPSLLQLAGEKEVFIFQLKKIGLPRSLRTILAAEDIVKAGVGIGYDLKELQKLALFKPAGFVDLATMAKQAGVKNHGLRGLAAVLLELRLSKSSQQSNWSRDTLTPVQIKYAATDAWVGQQIYFKMLQLDQDL